jgi:uncharacterized protein
MTQSNQPRFIVDTNVLVSAALFPNSVPRQALDYARSIGILLVSDTTCTELQQVLQRSKFDRYASRDRRELFLQTLLNKTERIEITETIDICRDPKDNQYLELAISGQANAIVTGDQDLLVLHPFRGISIVNAHDFLTMIF